MSIGIQQPWQSVVAGESSDFIYLQKGYHCFECQGSSGSVAVERSSNLNTWVRVQIFDVAQHFLAQEDGSLRLTYNGLEASHSAYYRFTPLSGFFEGRFSQ